MGWASSKWKPLCCSRFQVAATASYSPADEPHDAPLNYQALEISGKPWQEVVNALSGGHGAAVLQEKNFLGMMNFSISKRGSRHGAVRVVNVAWSNVERDTVGTSCQGNDDKQKALVTDSVEVTLRIDPPTEIVHFTPLGPSSLWRPFDSDMHEWMRYFTQFRQIGGDDIAPADGGKNEQPEQQQQAQRVTIKMKPQEPGIWRAEFNTREGTTLGEGLSETGHLVLRHTPK